MLRVIRGIGSNSRVLKLGGREIPRGAEFDTAEFPEFTSLEWDRWREHRLIESVTAVDEVKQAATRRHASELQRARGQFSEPVEQPMHSSLDCPVDGCGFVAKAPHGLTVHAGRKHRAS